MKKYKLTINGEKFETKILSYKGNYAKVSVNGVDYEIEIEQEGTASKQAPAVKSAQPVTVSAPAPQPVAKTAPPQAGSVLAPIPGTVIDIKVKVGDTVTADDVVLILEAMKMESEIHAGTNGVIKAIKVSKGDSVQDNDVLIEIGENNK